MNLSDFLGIVGVVLGVASLAYAYHQNRERKKLEEFMRSQSWYVFAKANNMSGIAQASLQTYKKAHEEQKNNEVIEIMAKADAFGQDLFKETIRQIQLSEPIYSKSTIAGWVADGKIGLEHAALFEQLCATQVGDQKSWWRVR